MQRISLRAGARSTRGARSGMKASASAYGIVWRRQISNGINVAAAKVMASASGVKGGISGMATWRKSVGISKQSGVMMVARQRIKQRKILWRHIMA